MNWFLAKTIRQSEILYSRLDRLTINKYTGIGQMFICSSMWHLQDVFLQMRWVNVFEIFVEMLKSNFFTNILAWSHQKN